jgi:hypothetical protein
VANRFEVHIASHFRESRIKLLSLVLDAILSWDQCVVNVVVASNIDSYLYKDFWREFASRFADKGGSLRLEVPENLLNPFLLTWAHKVHLPRWLSSAGAANDYFMYIEDDIVITSESIDYFVQTLGKLSGTRVMPGFIRYELHGDTMKLVDIMRTEYWERDRSAVISGTLFHANVNPYWGGYILDKGLAIEYLDSRSFSQSGSSFVGWEIRERAAMGLTFEKPSRKFKSRVVVPIVDGAPSKDCLVWHCANNYSEEGHPVVAQLTIAQAFQTESLRSYIARKLSAAPASLVRHARAWAPTVFSRTSS